jgi:Right handed beta helix region
MPSALNLIRLALSASLVIWTSADAQLFRAYLSGSGSDASACTLPAPCRLLPAALNAVASGGEIWMQGSANYNTSGVTIGKSVSILALPGVVGSLVAVNGAPAISITASDLTIVLRNVVIGPQAGATPGTHGVHMTGNSNLTIEGSVISGMTLDGIALGGGSLDLSNTTIRDNGRYGVLVQFGSHAEVATSRVIRNNLAGVAAFGLDASTNTASISDSVISDNYAGVRAFATVGTARISVTRCTITHNIVGLVCFDNATISTSGNLLAHNSVGWKHNCTGIYSGGNNQMDDSDYLGELTPRALR